MKPNRVLVCDCQPIVLEGLHKVLAAHPDFELIGSALTPEEALAALPGLAPDLILICDEPGAPVEAGLAARFRSVAPQARLVLWTATPQPEPAHLEWGFSGVLGKTRPVAALLECLRAVAQGVTWVDGRGETPEPFRRRNPPRLTPREREIVHLVAGGLKNREIAEALSISPGTVKVHLMHIFEKAGVADRLQLALLARRLLDREPEPVEPEAERAPVSK